MVTLSKSKKFLLICLFFIVGVFLGRFFNFQIMAVGAMIFIILGTIFWNHPNVRLVCLLGLVLVSGVGRFLFYTETAYLKDFYGQKMEITGIISEEPDQRDNKTYLTLSGLTLNGKENGGKILLSVGRFPEYHYGDKLYLNGKIQEPFESPGFSYKNYLSRFGIEAVVYYPQIERVESGDGNFIKRNLLIFKEKFTSTLSELLPEPQNSFLAGILVGLRRGIPAELQENFNATGTTHIIAISGFNITIIAQFLDYLLQRLGRRISFGLSLLAIALFVVLAGASASVVRAGIMGALGLIALNIGRVHAITNALVLTAAVMIGINPKILHFDVGFQLSFLALMGLVYLVPMFEPYFAKVPKFINKFLLPTIAAQIFVLPLLLYYFDRLSLISILTNLLVLPVIPVTMLLGFLGGIIALMIPVVALPLVWMAWAVLSYVISVVELTARIPFASVEITNFNLFYVIFYYIILTFILVRYYYPQLKIWDKLPKSF